MEYCGVRGPRDPAMGYYAEQFEICKDTVRNLTIVALHHTEWLTKKSKDIERKLFEWRHRNLVQHILHGLGTHPEKEDIKPALEFAFQSVDEVVMAKAKAHELDLPPACLATKFNSVVTIVHEGVVYVAGHNGTEVVLARSFEKNKAPYYLSSALHGLSRYRMMEGLSPSGEIIPDPDLFYFRKEHLQPDDAYLVMASQTALWYMQDENCLLPVLHSRIEVTGLKEACKSVIGRFRDADKTIVVVTLQEDAHQPAKRVRYDEETKKELLRSASWDFSNPDSPVPKDLDPLRYVLTLVDGKQQEPEPQTHHLYIASEEIHDPCSWDDLYVVSSL